MRERKKEGRKKTRRMKRKKRERKKYKVIKGLWSIRSYVFKLNF